LNVTRASRSRRGAKTGRRSSRTRRGRLPPTEIPRRAATFFAISTTNAGSLRLPRWAAEPGTGSPSPPAADPAASCAATSWIASDFGKARIPENEM
jgi:hypothetical protein